MTNFLFHLTPLINPNYFNQKIKYNKTNAKSMKKSQSIVSNLVKFIFNLIIFFNKIKYYQIKYSQITFFIDLQIKSFIYQ